jgi:hypothetical protein
MLQKLSLAITAVSIGLLSNVVLSRSRSEEGAKSELIQLLKIRDKFKESRVIDVIEDSLAGGHERPVQLKLTIKKDPALPVYVELHVPNLLYEPDTPNMLETAFKNIETLEKFSQVWNAAVRTTYWRSSDDHIEFMHLYLPNFKPSVASGYSPFLSLEWAKAKDFESIMVLSRTAVHQEHEPTGPAALFDIDYDFSSVLLADRSGNLVGALGIDPDLSEHVELWVFISVNARHFDPAQFGVHPKSTNVVTYGDFADFFPNLNKLPNDFQNQRLDSLNTFLQTAEQSKADIEIFGAKISSELIPLFGLPGLFILLFQFSAVARYIRSNVKRLEIDEASNWSFLLSGWPFLALSCATVFLLPAAASILSFLLVPGEALLPRPINLVLMLLVVLYAWTAFRALWRLRLRAASRLYHNTTPGRDPYRLSFVGSAANAISVTEHLNQTRLAREERGPYGGLGQLLLSSGFEQATNGEPGFDKFHLSM